MSKQGNNNREMIYRNHRAQGTANRSNPESRPEQGISQPGDRLKPAGP